MDGAGFLRGRGQATDKTDLSILMGKDGVLRDSRVRTSIPALRLLYDKYWLRRDGRKNQIACMQHFVKALKALSVFKRFCPALILSQQGQLLDAALNVANNVQGSPLSFLPQFSTGNY